MKLCGGGCMRAIPDDVRYCDECRAERKAQPNDGIAQHQDAGLYDAALDALNKGTRWQSIRRTVLGRCPLCARCQQSISVIADHIVPAQIAVQQARDSGRYPFDKWAGYYLLSNLRGLCRPCHGVKTLEDKTHVGPWPSVVEKEQAAPRRRYGF